MTTGEVLTIDGPSGLPQAAATLLYSTPDLLVVKGIVKAAAYEFLIDKVDEPMDESVVNRLYADVPQLEEVDKIVAEYWSGRGYKDYEPISPRMVPAYVSSGSMATHTDYPSSNTKQLVGPLSLSLGLTGRAMYYAQKPESGFIGEDGSFDAASWRKWKHSQSSPSPPRSSDVQERGDGIFFMNHPLQSYHKISTMERPRMAALFDYMVRKI